MELGDIELTYFFYPTSHRYGSPNRMDVSFRISAHVTAHQNTRRTQIHVCISNMYTLKK